MIGPGRVGTLWSIVATVRSGLRTGRPATRSALERLGARHLVHEMQIDVEERRRTVVLFDDVRVPELAEERRAAHCTTSAA